MIYIKDYINIMSSPYLFYTEYYLISGAYHIINVVNGILTYSASYSDNMKEYLRNQVASKQVVLNELLRNRNEDDARVNANPDNDVDEDGFVVIKMRRSKPKNASFTQTSMPFHSKSESNVNNINIKEECDVLLEKVIEQVMRDIISDVIIKIDAINK